MCVTLLYEMETTGSVSEMHFTALVENVIDWSVSHCLTPKITPAVWKTNGLWKKVSNKIHIKKKKKQTQNQLCFLRKNVNISLKECANKMSPVTSRKATVLVNDVVLSFSYARHLFGQLLYILFYSCNCKLYLISAKCTLFTEHL